MIDPALARSLRPVVRRRMQLQLSWRLAACWVLGALSGAVLMALHRWGLPILPYAFWGICLVSAVAVTVAVRSLFLNRTDWRWAARRVEERYPELKGLLLTAAQLPGKESGNPHYLEKRLVQEAVLHGHTHEWAQAVPGWQVGLGHVGHGMSLALLAWVLWALPVSVPKPLSMPGVRAAAGVTVLPGDTSLERGSSLVVLARFEGALPSSVDLVVGEAAEASRRIPLVKSLADPVFGSSVPEVMEPLVYHLEYAGQKTRSFRVSVFEYPRLLRADAELTFPAYTGLAPRRVEDTRRLSAVEGSRMDLILQLNKPVASAALIAKTQERTRLPLQSTNAQTTAYLKQFLFASSMTYELQLVDAEGRTNKLPTQFVFEVLTNRQPELRLAAPRGDLRPSALEEIRFEGTAWDDFGLSSFGLGYTVAGEETVLLELGRAIPAKEKRTFKHRLKLEDLGVQPDQLISWFLWADDSGPEGETRRTTTDLFFGEVRPFDEVFREGQSNESQSDSQESGEQGEQQGNQTARLAELQKQILSATWKLQREHRASASPTYTKDVLVVMESQKQALEQAETMRERAEEPRTAGLWEAVTKEMELAAQRLEAATNAPPLLKPAVVAEQSAYQALLRLQAREHEVARANSRSRGQNAGRQGNQRQLEQMELTQSENRYERQSEARAPQTPERREQLQVMNRLQELARRQQDLNERLKELQSALQEARTEKEREEVRRRLKRLQEEEQQMLADVDEVRQRMERPENQSRMAEERRQLDQTRNEVQRAAEAASQGSTSQALASGTRAQRQLQDLRDEMRKENSSEFTEEMRELRNQARELSSQQEEIARKLETEAATGRKTLSDSDQLGDVPAQIARQKERLTNLVERATDVSQQAETSQPLLSRQLYDTLRRFSQRTAGGVKESQEELLRRGLMTRNLYDRLQDSSQPDGAKLLDAAEEMVRQSAIPQARQIGQRARAGFDELKTGVERAAESVLGDDTEALRQARQELDRVSQDLQREMARSEPGNASSPASRTGSESEASAHDQGRTGTNNAAAGRQSNDAQSRQGDTPGQAGDQPGSQQAARSGQGQGRGEPGARPGELDRQGEAERTASGTGRSAPTGGNRQGREVGGNYGADSGGPLNDGELRQAGPLTGDEFSPWSDRLREVEEMIDFPDLRNRVAGAREQARSMRQEFRKDLKKPDWAQVRLRVLEPLVEVRNRIAEELARRESREALVPIDRDPVPSRYSEMVRRYYEDLGKDK